MRKLEWSSIENKIYYGGEPVGGTITNEDAKIVVHRLNMHEKLISMLMVCAQNASPALLQDISDLIFEAKGD